jgi:hypothetical protein
MKTHLTSLLIIVAVFVGFASAGPNAHAATITVSNTNDNGADSLRQALADASDGDTIDFSITGAITLTTGELLVNKNLTISGPRRSQSRSQRERQQPRVPHWRGNHGHHLGPDRY